MSKIQLKWIDTDYCFLQKEVPQNKKSWERQENKRINLQIKQINRKQKHIQFTQFGRTR